MPLYGQIEVEVSYFIVIRTYVWQDQFWAAKLYR